MSRRTGQLEFPGQEICDEKFRFDCFGDHWNFIFQFGVGAIRRENS